MRTADEESGVTETPLAALSEAELRPSEADLAGINAAFRGGGVASLVVGFVEIANPTRSRASPVV